MALGRCNKCGDRLRAGSATCQRCGAKKSRVKLILAGIVVVQVCVIAFYMHYGMPHVGGIHVVVSDAAPHQAGPAVSATPATGWVYFETRDDMIGDVTRHARVISKTYLVPGQPDDHGSEGAVELRASPAYGRSALITLHLRGSDPVADKAELHAQFDGGDVAVFHASASADTANLTLVVQDAAGFTARLKAAHTLWLKALLPANHQRVTVFDVGGLKWD